MKKSIYTCFFLLLATLGMAQKTVNDPNVEARQVGSFTGLSISNAFDVILTQGNTEALAVSASDKEDNQYIKTEVSNGVLKIWFDDKRKGNWGKNRKLRAYVSVKTLNMLHLSGATDTQIEGELSSSSLKIQLSGASDLEGRIVVSGEMKVEISGASDIQITGSAREVDIEASGASEFSAYEFTAGSADIEASGACSVTLTVEKEITAELSGASSLNYKGNAAVKSVKATGASSVNKKS